MSWAIALLALLAVLVVLQTFRPVNAYGTGHWLFNYGHGFIRRGLVGTLFAPIAYGFPPARVQNLIHVIGWTSTCVFLALLVRAGLRAGAGLFGQRGPLRLSVAGVAVTAVILASPAATWLGHTSGYFDVYLLALGLLSVWLLHSDRSALWVGLTCLVGILIHEVFVVVVLPGVFVAALVRGYEQRAAISADEGQVSKLDRLRPWLPALVVAGLGAGLQGLFIALGPTDPASLRLLEHEVFATELVRGEDCNLFYALEQTSATANGRMREYWSREYVQRFGLYDALSHLPVLMFVLAAALAQLRARGFETKRVALLACLGLGAALCPLVLHFVAWDIGRINSYTDWSALFVWLAMCRPRGQESEAEPRKPLVWILAGAVVVVLGATTTPALMNKYEVAHYPEMFKRLPDELDKFGPRATYRDLGPKQVPFENANFEAGDLRNWEVEGDAFANQPTWRDNAVTRLDASVGVEGDWWIGTYEDNPEAGAITGETQGDEPRGRLRSVEFEVTHDHLVFKLGGGRHTTHVFVAFEVEGEEVARFTGTKTEHMRPVVLDTGPYRGKAMRIVIRDTSKGKWGHINVDGFAWILDDELAEAVMAEWPKKKPQKKKKKPKAKKKTPKTKTKPKPKQAPKNKPTSTRHGEP